MPIKIITIFFTCKNWVTLRCIAENLQGQLLFDIQHLALFTVPIVKPEHKLFGQLQASAEHTCSCSPRALTSVHITLW